MMALRRRSKPVRGSKPVSEEEDDDLDVIVPVDDEEGDEIGDPDEEDEPVAKSRKPVKVAPAKPVPAAAKKPAKKVVEDDEDELEDELPKPSKRAKVSREEEPEDVEEAVAEEPKKRVGKVISKSGTNPVNDILTAMSAGQVLIVIKETDQMWKVAMVDETVVKFSGEKQPRTRRGREYWNQVANPEFIAWKTEWRALTYEEKKAKAKKLGVKWEGHENPKIDVIRLTAAVREKLGISKYKAEFQSREAREAVLRN